MKNFLSALLVLACGWATAQTVTVNGNVSDASGRPVQYAFIGDIQHNRATFTDSTGAFKLVADAASPLQVFANNYEDQQVKLGGETTIKVILQTSADKVTVASLNNGQAQTADAFLRARQPFVTGAGAVPSGGSQYGGAMGGSDVIVVKQGFVQEPTRGSRYLFPDWVPGYGLDKNDKIVVEKTNMYNFDKIGGVIIYTNDGKSMAQVSPGQLKSFTLFDKQGHTHTYENAPEINNKPFVEVLLKTPKYKIYKQVDTRLSRADYHTDGVLQMGNRYDEYVDNKHYYFVGEEGKTKSISLKKSTLKKLLGTDADSFIASQGSRDVDEEYVKDLGASLGK